MRHTWSEWSLITAAVICRVRALSGDRSLPVHARWCPRGSRKGASSVEDRTRETADGPGCRAVPLEAPRPKGGRSRWWKPPPSRPGPKRGARAATGSAPYLDPSFQNTALLHNPRSTTRTPDPLFILDTSSPLDTILLFLLIKASPRPDATPTVSVVCSSRHIYIYGIH